MTPVSAILPSEAAAAGEGPAVPRHVAIIMDGNGRWAARRGLPRFEGHRRARRGRAPHRARQHRARHRLSHGLFLLDRELVAAAAEVAELMGLIRRFIRNDLADLHARNVRVRIIGESEGIRKIFKGFWRKLKA